jgi:hypothetical protein
VHLLTGAEVIGLEIQPALVEAARKLAARLNITCLAAIEGDATELIGRMHEGSVFFFYCPFSGERLDRVLAALEVLSRSRPIRLCCVDLPLPALPWLELAAAPGRAASLVAHRRRDGGHASPAFVFVLLRSGVLQTTTWRWQTATPAQPIPAQVCLDGMAPAGEELQLERGSASVLRIEEHGVQPLGSGRWQLGTVVRHDGQAALEARVTARERGRSLRSHVPRVA